MKLLLIKSNQPNGHYCAQRHFSFAGDVVAEDALTPEQWVEVRSDAWLSVVDGEADAETVALIDGVVADAETVALIDAGAADAAQVEVDAVTLAPEQKAKGKAKS